LLTVALVVIALTLTVILGILLWIAFGIRQLSMCSSALLYTSYPAFPVQQVEHECRLVQKSLAASLEAERKVFGASWWNDVSAGRRPPTSAERKMMNDCCREYVFWERALMHSHFLTEANSKVRVGIWTLAEAHFHYRSLQSEFLVSLTEENRLLEDWCARLAGRKTVEPDQLASELAERRDAYLNGWKARFKAMHDPKPVDRM
jgi:hypothetical protein